MISHYHCPNDCENPQPFGDKHYCGRCYYEYGILVECYLCTPETCNEDDDIEKEKMK